MIATLSQSFIFEAAHSLQRPVPLEHFTPSARLHGHTYTATVAVSGAVGKSGMIEFRRKGFKGISQVDLFELRKTIAKARDQLDHRYLNEIDGLGPATLESLCLFIGAIVSKDNLPLRFVEVSRATGDACRIDWS